MPQPPNCAIVIISPPGSDAPDDAVLRSVQAADDGRVFARLLPIPVPCRQGRAAAWRQGLQDGAASGADWVFLLDAGERLHPEAMHLLAPALAGYDVLWGALEVEDAAGNWAAPRISRFAARTGPEFFHMALRWWVGGSLLIRAAAAQELGKALGEGEGWFAAALLHLWASARCLKACMPLTRAAELPEVPAADRAVLVDELARNPRFIEIPFGNETLKLPYSGRNPALEREQLRGMFYEQADLMSLRALVPEGATIVDIGANTGNHTLFFAKVLKAGRVIPFEPNPDTVGFLKAMITANGLTNVDTSQLGIALGAAEGRADISTGRRGYLGTARMKAASAGDVPVRPLGTLVREKVDLLKIDVEDMEVDVLSGAEALIMRDRPLLMLEIMDENILPILDITKRLGYTVRDIFADFDYANYLLMPGAAEDRK